MAVFFAEQAIQLRVEALLLRMLGYVPRSHGVRELLGLVAKVLSAMGRDDLSEHLGMLVRDERDVLVLLEEAYTRSRYLPETYERLDAEKALEIARSLFKLLDGVEHEVFRGA